MIFKVKKLSKFEDLLLEADIIRIGNEVDDFSKYSEKEKQDAFDKIDNMIDDIIDKNIDDYLKNPNFINAFTAEQVMESMRAYLDYSKTRIAVVKDQVARLISADVYSSDEVRLLNADVAKIQARIEVLDKIYREAKLERANSLISSISEIQADIREFYMNPVKMKSAEIKQSIQVIKTSTDKSVKYKEAEKIYTDFEEITEIAEEYPNEVKTGVNQAKEQVEEEIKSEFTEEELEEIRGRKTTNIFFTKIVKDILEFEQLYASEAEIKETARLLRNVRIANNDNIDADSKMYLTAWVDQIEATLLKKAQDKSLRLELNKGIHYDFNIALPLFKTVMLPVTGKQIADNTFIAKAKQKFIDITKVIFGDDAGPRTELGQSMYNLGAAFSRIYSVALNRTAKMIGKAVSGREGEIKADAVSRMFMPTTEYLDKVDKVAEEAAAPGMAMQVPGSIGSMGPITPPTQTTLGSGDNFNPKKKKKRIMEFSEFLKNKNL
jgi:hypothetical protein